MWCRRHLLILQHPRRGALATRRGCRQGAKAPRQSQAILRFRGGPSGAPSFSATLADLGTCFLVYYVPTEIPSVVFLFETAIIWLYLDGEIARANRRARGTLKKEYNHAVSSKDVSSFVSSNVSEGCQ